MEDKTSLPQRFKRSDSVKPEIRTMKQDMAAAEDKTLTETFKPKGNFEEPQSDREQGVVADIPKPKMDISEPKMPDSAPQPVSRPGVIDISDRKEHPRREQNIGWGYDAEESGVSKVVDASDQEGKFSSILPRPNHDRAIQDKPETPRPETSQERKMPESKPVEKVIPFQNKEVPSPKRPISSKSSKPPVTPAADEKDINDQEDKKHFLTKPLRYVLIVVSVIVAVSVVGGFFYWWNYIRQGPVVPLSHYKCSEDQCIKMEGEGVDECLVDADCRVPEPDIPTALIPMANLHTLEFYTGEEGQLLDEFKKLGKMDDLGEGEMQHVLVKMIGRTGKKYLSESELFSFLGLHIPVSIQKTIAAAKIEGDNYMLFFYKQPDGAAKRLGLAIKVDPTQVDQEVLEAWEMSMVSDLTNILLQDSVQLPLGEEFKDSERGNIAIRYINFPNPDLSIDYALVNNLLVITTSRSHMFSTIDIIFE